jgi:teichuronic acid biosynthesis glycosyltransferase TuaC
MNVLTYTSLFPNSEMPEHGIFVARRMAAFAAVTEHQVEVVAPVPYFPSFIPAPARWKTWSRVPAQEVRDGLRVHHPRYLNPPVVGMRHYGRLMAAGTGATLARLLAGGFRFDVIDAHFAYPDGYAALQLARKLNRPVVVSARGADVYRNNKFPAIVPLLREVCAGAARFIAVSRELADDLVDLGAPPDRVHVIPNGIDATVFHPVGRSEACRALGLDAAEQWLVVVASFSPHKGHRFVIEALKGVGVDRLRAGRVRVAFIGQGREREALAREVEAAGLGDVIKFVGQVAPPRLQLWYSAASLKILPSTQEGSANALLEALACGAPVVASRVGENGAVVREGENGYLIHAGDVAGLQAALEASLAREWDRPRIAREGGRRDWRAVAREVASVLTLAATEAGSVRRTAGRAVGRTTGRGAVSQAQGSGSE